MKKQVAEQASVARKAYQAPRLVTHGDVQKLTLHHDNGGCFSDIHGKFPKYD